LRQRVEASINPMHHGRCEARCGERAPAQPVSSPRPRQQVRKYAPERCA
jgi:hypothetical protein